MMGGKTRLLLLIFGLCCVASSYSVPVPEEFLKIYGDNLFEPAEDITKELEAAKAERERLETLISIIGPDEVEATYHIADLEKANLRIEQIESMAKVLYQDHLALMARQKEEFEEEKGKLVEALKTVELQLKQAIETIESVN